MHGASQIGKTHAVLEFGTTGYDAVLCCNLGFENTLQSIPLYGAFLYKRPTGLIVLKRFLLLI